MTTAIIPPIGATETLAKAISEADVALFTLVTNDLPPLPTGDPMPAAPAGHAVVPGAFVAALLAAAAARHLGGLAAAHLVRAEVTASAPAYTDDTLTVSAQVAAYDAATQTLRVAATCANQDGARLAEGVFELRPGA
jgi:phosphate acetyltransferase/phosphate butyryltransferase